MENRFVNIKKLICSFVCEDAPVNQTNANGSTSGDDIFSSFLSATPANSSPAPATGATNGSTDSTGVASKTDEENFFNQPAPTAQEKSKMTKDSILALYGTPSHQQSPFAVQGQFPHVLIQFPIRTLIFLALFVSQKYRRIFSLHFCKLFVRYHFWK